MGRRGKQKVQATQEHLMKCHALGVCDFNFWSEPDEAAFEVKWADREGHDELKRFLCHRCMMVALRWDLNVNMPNRRRIESYHKLR
jgi:hypothetical protein